MRRKPVGTGSSPSVGDYINAANDAYTQPDVPTLASPSTIYPGSLTILQSHGKPVVQYIPQDGFYACAFVTTSNQVIVTFEGTNFFTKNAEFTAGQVVDDADIVAGKLAPSFTDSLSFTKTALAAARTQKRPIQASNVFIAGHSLGAADAEYVAARTGMSGTTFGTPGVAAKYLSKAPSQLTNYVEYGDPVGNYDASANSPIANIVKSISPTTQHYGAATYVGSLVDPIYVSYFPYVLPPAYADLVAASVAYSTGTQDGVEAAAAALALAVPAHLLSQYAADIPGAALADSDHSYGANLSIVCFAQGTAIRTAHGDIAVEALRIGDLVVTSSGATRPIRWLGHRTIDCRRHPDPRAAWPVRIARDAFGPAAPARDLYVSPAHAICVDMMGEVLIPAIALVDDGAITQAEVDSVTYWHVELDSHNVILAENLRCESYLDMGNRGFFADSGVVSLGAGPDAVALSRAAFCRPFHSEGALVEVVRRRLAGRAAVTTPACAA